MHSVSVSLPRTILAQAQLSSIQTIHHLPINTPSFKQKHFRTRAVVKTSKELIFGVIQISIYVFNASLSNFGHIERVAAGRA